MKARQSVESQMQTYDAAEAAALRVNPDPRCPRCGFTMCQLFDERPLTPLATAAIPNGKYQCYHCTPIGARTVTLVDILRSALAMADKDTIIAWLQVEP